MSEAGLPWKPAFRHGGRPSTSSTDALVGQLVDEGARKLKPLIPRDAVQIGDRLG